ncbi:hypothetical protein KSP40_PGU020050 [Platanthera guangdongensis]|uniref:Uncharacterized protein n=1 Tax=Platanthera guangdongensis TaxID=2320717 RepID=A0ABR2LY40_9ASPA
MRTPSAETASEIPKPSLSLSLSLPFAVAVSLRFSLRSSAPVSLSFLLSPSSFRFLSPACLRRARRSGEESDIWWGWAWVASLVAKKA